MKNFACLAKGIDTTPFLEEIANVPNAWDQLTGRQDKIKVQREARAIPLRGIRKSRINGRRRRDVHETRNTTMSRNFPSIMNFIRQCAARLDGDPGRAKIANLPPGKKVFPHIDRGEYYRLRDRFHLVLRSAAGNYLATGDEKVHLQEGEFWWFDNKVPHEAFNGSDSERIHLIFDLALRNPEHLLHLRQQEEMLEGLEDALPPERAELPLLARLPQAVLTRPLTARALVLLEPVPDGDLELRLLGTGEELLETAIRSSERSR